ncbi:MAG TPA: hypothetical protein VKT77_13100, partial [Chthonomonadaceae bacterium]|nr:hypothetical protein [Chthonomonadaceae bacterium]
MRALPIALAFLSALAAPAGRAAMPEAADAGFCKPQTWLFGGWVAPPRIPLLADVNGDGYADFVYASPKDKSIDVALNGKGWKPLRGQRLISNLPQEIAAICAGHFGGKTIDLVVLGRQGRLVKALSVEGGRFPATTPLADLKLPAGRTWLLAGRIGAGPLDEIVVVSANGHVRILDAAGKPLRELALGAQVQDAALGDVDGNGRTELAVRSGGQVELYRLG